MRYEENQINILDINCNNRKVLLNKIKDLKTIILETTQEEIQECFKGFF